MRQGPLDMWRQLVVGKGREAGQQRVTSGRIRCLVVRRVFLRAGSCYQRSGLIPRGSGSWRGLVIVGAIDVEKHVDPYEHHRRHNPDEGAHLCHPDVSGKAIW